MQNRSVNLKLIQSLTSNYHSDVDECKILEASDCHEKANCTNTNGSFECVCLPGFSGDGRGCYNTGSFTCTLILICSLIMSIFRI